MKKFVVLFAFFLCFVGLSLPVFADSGNEEAFSLSSAILSGLVFAAIIAAVVVFAFYSQLKNVSGRDAMSYFREDRFEITHSHDLFLYRSVVRTEKPRNDNQSGGRS